MRGSDPSAAAAPSPQPSPARGEGADARQPLLSPPMPNAPAKRAAYLMIAIGVALLAGSFVSTMYALLRPEWLNAQLAPHKELIGDHPLLNQPALTWAIAIGGALGLIESGLSIALGLWILRGHRWAIVTSLVLTLLRLLVVGLFAMVAILAATLASTLDANDAGLMRYEPAAAPPPAAVGPWTIGIAIGCAVILLLLAIWLIQALRRQPENRDAGFQPVNDASDAG